jgi:hypothetical protein
LNGVHEGQDEQVALVERRRSYDLVVVLFGDAVEESEVLSNDRAGDRTARGLLVGIGHDHSF